MPDGPIPILFYRVSNIPNSLGKNKMAKNWQTLELRVREIASYLWNCSATPETLNGVKVDCVLRQKRDYWILIEITVEDNLDKLRTDLAKFASVRPYLTSQNIYSECFFVSEKQLTDSLRTTGEGQHVNVQSLSEFESQFLNYAAYRHARSSQPFGSAVNPISGKKDDREYVRVKYLGVDVSREYSIEDIAEQLLRGHRIVLTGNYGTGKSRCTQELFSILASKHDDTLIYPISIDLRNHWGARRGTDIIRTHLEDLGLTTHADSVIRVLDKGKILLLLDGFDELGSQTWSDDPAEVRRIREKSLAGVNDLIGRTTGPVLITGREHYFNSKDEMLGSLGLRSNNTAIIQCSDEFSNDEIQEYLNKSLPGVVVPSWLPKRPLIFQVLSTLDQSSLSSVLSDTGEVLCWDMIISAVCDREVKINHAIDASSVHSILVRLARITRQRPANVGPLHPRDLNRAFEDVRHLPPDDDTSIILQRLATLGRVSAESPDRQFVDTYFLDGLRGEDVIRIADHDEESVFDEPWLNPTGRLGTALIADEIRMNGDTAPFMRALRLSAQRRNRLLAGDILSALILASEDPIDFGGLILAESHINELNFSERTVHNLTIRDSFIEELDISGVHPQTVRIENCEIGSIRGIAEAKGCPQWISGCKIGKYESVRNVAAIRQSALSEEQRILVTIIRKTFFQPGTGRKEEALMRGLGQSNKKRAAEKILLLLRDEGILDRFKGNDGWVYKPQREHTQRMQQMMAQLTLSSDPVWTKATRKQDKKTTHH
jgi:hypothetical protein